MRKAILGATRDIDVSTVRPMSAISYVAHLGLAEGELRSVQRALEYLQGKGYLRTVVAGRQRHRIVVGITAEGIDEMERPDDYAKPRSEEIHFNAAVGSVQVGDHNTAHITQNIGGDIGQLIEALIALRQQTATDPTHSAINALAAQAVEEASKQRSVTDRLAGFLMGIGQVVQSTGAMLPAYHLIYAVAPALNVHGLPPPPVGS
jgi:hypothetical protein